MTIKELKEKIKDLPDHMDVCIQQNDTEFNIGSAESAIVRVVTFSEGTSDGPTATDMCLVISDDL